MRFLKLLLIIINLQTLRSLNFGIKVINNNKIKLQGSNGIPTFGNPKIKPIKFNYN